MLRRGLPTQKPCQCRVCFGPKQTRIPGNFGFGGPKQTQNGPIPAGLGGRVGGTQTQTAAIPTGLRIQRSVTVGVCDAA